MDSRMSGMVLVTEVSPVVVFFTPTAVAMPEYTMSMSSR